MISVITPSIRLEGLEIVKRALDRQSVPFEWLIGSPFDPKMGTWVKDDFEGGFWTLNRIYNKLIKEAKGDVIVSWQDYTFANPDALERFSYHVENEVVVSGVGDKYKDGEKVWSDPRKTGVSFREVPFTEIEFNFCAMPRKALYDIGGFDESLDFEGFGMDGFSVVERLNMLGKYKFVIDEGIESFSEVHGRVDNWEKDNLLVLVQSWSSPYLG